MNLFRRLIPATLAARFFWGIAAASLISAVAIWSWLYSRFYDTLDREASFRMKQMADAVLSEIRQVRLSDNYNDQRHELITRFWQFEKSAGLVQNLYWLDLTGDRPVFIASFSQTLGMGSSLQPPASEDAEDLVYDYINDLDRGEMVFPDPYAYGVERRFKIVLCPVLDANGLLESVVGIEADMEYLKLAGEFRSILAEGVGLAVLISLLISFLLAGNLSAKITIFGRNVDLISKGHKPEDLHLTIKELDELYQAFVKMAADLEQQRAHVKQVFSRKLDELAFTGGAIAHEIRNPLSAIEMHFGLLKRSLGRDAAQQDCQAPIEEIDQQLQHLRRLLTTFLNYSRKVLPQLEMVNLHEFLNRVINARRQVLGNFAVEIVAGDDVCASFDPVMLQQVIENLVNNSFRAAGDKQLKITINAGISDCLLQIKIADNGPGIAAQMREQLFTPFASGNLDGNGFGLALCRKLVEAHGGEIYHQENTDSGAVFVIEYRSMKILVVDDNASLARAIKAFLKQEGHVADLAGSVKEGHKLLELSNYDLVITDLKLPDGEGLEIIRKAREGDVTRLPEVILMTAFGSVESAVTAMRLGASDYLTKPVSMEEFSFRIQKIAELRRLDDEKNLLKRQRDSLLDVTGFGNILDDIVGSSEAVGELKQLIARVAPFPSTVLITGETGAGKEMVARAIHQLSPRVNGPFVRVNCASIPETLFEAELFGHEKGAFTDARQRRTGSFEAADQGTVFLDEVGEVPLAMQAKLLRVLQEKEVMRIGSSTPIQIDVRIVAATNRNLEKMVADGMFREDLLYRLSVFNIVVPPLRARREDFMALCRSLLERLGKELGKPALHISEDLIQKLSLMPWPGNVRQLKNALERAVVLSEDNKIDLKFFASPERVVESGQADTASGVAIEAPVYDAAQGLIGAIETLERRMIVDALQKAAGTKSRAAEILKIPRTQLLYRMKKLGLGEGDD